MDEEPRDENILRYASPGKRPRARPSVARMLMGGLVGFFFGTFLGVFVLALTSHSSLITNRTNRAEVIVAVLGVVIACTGIFAYLGYKFELK